jgi:uncharacterized protein
MKDQAQNPQKNLTFDISDVHHGEIGLIREFHLEVTEEFDPSDFILTTSIQTDIVLIRAENAITVQLENFTYQIETTCRRCLKAFPQSVTIPLASRDFLFVKPKDDTDIEDLFLADIRHMEVDLHNMFRQEILLHFDAFPVCSSQCKGICPTCGQDLNKKECGHGPVEQVDDSHGKEESVKPFFGLKTMIRRKKE